MMASGYSTVYHWYWIELKDLDVAAAKYLPHEECSGYDLSKKRPTKPDRAAIAKKLNETEAEQRHTHGEHYEEHHSRFGHNRHISMAMPDESELLTLA